MYPIRLETPCTLIPLFYRIGQPFLCQGTAWNELLFIVHVISKNFYTLVCYGTLVVHHCSGGVSYLTFCVLQSVANPQFSNKSPNKTLKKIPNQIPQISNNQKCRTVNKQFSNLLPYPNIKCVYILSNEITESKFYINFNQFHFMSTLFAFYECFT